MSVGDQAFCRRLRLKCDGTRAENRFRLSGKRTSPFKSAGASVHSITGSQDVRISGSNVGYTMFRGSVRVLATHSIHQFPLHFPSRASPYAITFQLDSNTGLFCVAAQTYSNMTANLLTFVLVNSRTVHFLIFSTLTNKTVQCFMICVLLCFT